MISSSAVQVLVEVIFATLEVWAFVFSVFGNSIVIYVMSREKKLRRRSNYYIVSVAIADFLVGLIGIPCSIYMVDSFIFVKKCYKSYFTLQRITSGPHNFVMCLTFISFLLGILSVSIFSLVAVSVDRYLALCHPIFYRQSFYARATKRIIGICWFLCIIGLFPLFGWNTGTFVDNRCHPSIVLSFGYIIFLSITVSCIPTTFIVVIYFLIFKGIIMQVGKLLYK